MSDEQEEGKTRGLGHCAPVVENVSAQNRNQLSLSSSICTFLGISAEFSCVNYPGGSYLHLYLCLNKL